MEDKFIMGFHKHLFLLPFPGFFFSAAKKCANNFSAPGYSSKPLEGYHRHSSGLRIHKANSLPRCWPFSGWYFCLSGGVFFVLMLCLKEYGNLGGPYWVKYIYCVYVHTSMYGRIHTPCIIFNVYCMPHISNTMVGKFSTLPGNEWSRAILPADMGPEK